MFAFFKAVFAGAFLTFIVALFIGSSGSRGGVLNVQGFVLEGYHLYWSWPLFLAATGLAFAILLMME